MGVPHLALRPHEVVAAFAEHTRRPTQAQIDALAARQIPIWSVAGIPGTGEFAIGFAKVQRLDTAHFEFSDIGEPAVVVIARDAAGASADLVAAPLGHRWIASWFGRVSMLGEQNVCAPRLDPHLTVHVTIFDWLRDFRNGVILIDEPRAARTIRDFGPFRVLGDIERGLRLRALLTPEPPSIVVSLDEERHAA